MKSLWTPWALLLLAAAPSHSQTPPSRVSPAALPLPLPGVQPMPPDRLRTQNPWAVPLTGPWRFRLTHGRILDGQFFSEAALGNGITASSNESENLPQNAFDGSAATRWCAGSGTFPQWLQADLGRPHRISGVTLAWERPDDRYQCRIEGGPDGRTWTTLADATAAPGIGDGPVALSGTTDVRYVRVTVVGVAGGHWASLREFQIHYTEAGRDVVWRPAKTQPAADPRDDEFTKPAFSDQKWDTVTVPSNWEMAGYSLPTYNSVDNTVGQYRRSVPVPASWTGRRIVWRFDGALDGAEVFVNGQRAGYHESGYTAFDVDLTGLIRPGQRNLLAVRVSKTTPSVDCETGDFQCMGGIYRDTSLIAVPQTHVHDITVRTPLAPNYRDATLDADVTVMGTPGQAVTLSGALVGTDGKRLPVHLAGQGRIGEDGTVIAALSSPVMAPKLWSAEKPNLYYLVLQLTRAGQPVERVEQRFGFRQVEIRNDIVLWNGRPIKCTGVCRHDFWADKGFALTDREWNTDLTLMKAANINAIRTSHYNHAARFLELCEERGFYILDEVPFCWINEKNNDPAFAPALLLRAADTLGRDKNRPCVLSWSLGNENGVGKNSQTVIDFVKAHDPTRPSFISQGGYWGPKGQSFQDMHYPTPADVDNYVTKDSGKLPAQFSEQPHMFYQKDAQDYDPGVSDLWSEALTKTWNKIWQAPTILGSFIWEWQNQGIADKNADRKRDFYYGPGHLRQENNKGVVTSDRSPKAEYWIVKMTYAPVVVGTRTVRPSGGSCLVPLTNHYTFTDLSELACRWMALRGDTPLGSGTVRIACAPMQSVQAPFPAPPGMTALWLEFRKPDGTDTVARLSVQDAPVSAPPAGPAGGGTVTVQDTPDTLALSNALQQVAFDKHTGGIQSWRVRGRELLTGAAVLNLGQSRGGQEKDYYQSAQPPTVTEAALASQPQPGGGVRVTATGTVRPSGGGAALGTLVTTYDIAPDAKIAVHWTLTWQAPATHLWEAGMQLSVPAGFSRMDWARDAYFTEYPTGHIGAPSGTCRTGDVVSRSSKRGLHWLTLRDAAGSGLALLAADTPLIARAASGTGSSTLFASREVAGPKDLSWPWVADHDIVADAGKPLSGAFTLAATGP